MTRLEMESAARLAVRRAEQRLSDARREGCPVLQSCARLHWEQAQRDLQRVEQVLP